MGASYDEILQDYMLTPCNLYGVKPGTKQYNLLVEDNLHAIFQALFHVNDPRQADLKRIATEYLISSGVTEATLEKAKSHLSE